MQTYDFSQLEHGGRLELIVGPMFSGKSEELIRRVTRATIANQRVQVFKPALDNRYHHSALSSHNGRTFEAIAVRDVLEMQAHFDEATQVIAIDEAQFLDDALPAWLNTLANAGYRVIVAGLDLDFRAEPFGVMPELLARAEYVDKLTAVCMVCGCAATRSQRLIAGAPAHYDDPIILTGASETYEARCRQHHVVIQGARTLPLFTSEQIYRKESLQEG